MIVQSGGDKRCIDEPDFILDASPLRTMRRSHPDLLTNMSRFSAKPPTTYNGGTHLKQDAFRGEQTAAGKFVATTMLSRGAGRAIS
jgi:hypothetical protein